MVVFMPPYSILRHYLRSIWAFMIINFLHFVPFMSEFTNYFIWAE